MRLIRRIWIWLTLTKFHMPWNNLGCLGFSCPGLYCDLFIPWYSHLGVYIHYRGVRTRYYITIWYIQKCRSDENWRIACQ